MTRPAPRFFACLLVATVLLLGCPGGGKHGGRENLLPPETFHWIRQPIAFAPPPAPWEREGSGGGGTTGVRFVLRGGGGQCIIVAAFQKLAERNRQDALARLVARYGELSQREFFHELSLARPRMEDPVSEREAGVSRVINQALDQASSDCLAGKTAFVSADLGQALRGASQYEPTLEELLPHIRLRPELMRNPEWWRIGYERDTVVAGLPAFASDDTLIVDGDTKLYHEVFWVVGGCAFKATFQGEEENLELFHRVVDSIQFPDPNGEALSISQ